MREIKSQTKLGTLANCGNALTCGLKSYHDIFPWARIKTNFGSCAEAIATNLQIDGLGKLAGKLHPRHISWGNGRCYFSVCVIIWSLLGASFLAPHVLELLQQNICPQISLNSLFLITSYSREKNRISGFTSLFVSMDTAF